MPNPFSVIAYQSEKGRLSEEEQQALARARFRQKLYGVIGGAAGVGLGYYLSRRQKSLPMRGFMIFFNAAFLYSITSSYASFTSLRDLSDASKYPHISAAMKDISREILRSRGVDPEHPEMGRAGTIPHRPDFKNLPPSLTDEERSTVQKDEGVFYTGLEPAPSAISQPQQAPAFGGVQTQQHQASAWDTIRKSDSRPENAWEKLRKQTRSTPSANTAQQFEDAWSKLNQSDGFGTSDTQFSDSGSNTAGFDGRLASGDNFPRSREDFEGASQGKPTKYGDSVYS
ncbi:hypothetical protein GQ54DRAFT_297319 [Martensiomyces pterosporus]|nr:hypothetical protein GQ54DRAFT_297319 [Martensiomyces pterosporus]